MFSDKIFTRQNIPKQNISKQNIPEINKNDNDFKQIETTPDNNLTLPNIDNNITFPNIDNNITVPNIDNNITVPTIDDNITLPTIDENIILPPYQYIGCYQDYAERAMSEGISNVTISDCYKTALNAGAKYFGMQYPQGSSDPKNKAHCFYDLYDDEKYNKYGLSTACLTGDNNQILGGAGANAVYKITDPINVGIRKRPIACDRNAFNAQTKIYMDNNWGFGPTNWDIENCPQRGYTWTPDGYKYYDGNKWEICNPSECYSKVLI